MTWHVCQDLCRSSAVRRQEYQALLAQGMELNSDAMHQLHEDVILTRHWTRWDRSDVGHNVGYDGGHDDVAAIPGA